MATARSLELHAVLDPDTGEYVEPHEVVDGIPVDRYGRRYAEIVYQLTVRAEDDAVNLDPPTAIVPVRSEDEEEAMRLGLTFDEYEQAYEIVDGQALEWPIMGTYPEEIASILQEILGPFVRQNKLGRCITEGRFKIREKKDRRPDLAFISYDRWPKGRRAPNRVAWPILPDLAIEVVSISDKAWDVLDKIREYFEGGVREVWLVFPKQELVHIYRAFDRIEVVTRDGVIDGGAVIPGFRLPLVDLFLEEAEEVPPPATEESTR